MLIANLRKILIFVLLAIAVTYFTVSNVTKLNATASNELLQSSQRIDEYLQIIHSFISDVSEIGTKYFSVDDVRIDSDMQDLVFNDNNTYNTPDDLTKLNRKLIGIGSYEDVLENSYYINVAYAFDRFFSDISAGFSYITSVSYYSKHDFIYVYSNIGEDYLEKIDYNDEKIKNEKTLQQIENGEDFIWTPVINESYLNEKELVLSVPVYDDDEVEGVIKVNYSLSVIDDIIDNNFYETYLIDENGTIIASNYYKLDDEQFHNVIENKLFGITRGKSIIDYAFNVYKDDWENVNLNYYKFSDYIADDFAMFMYVPIYAYLSIIIIGFVSVFFVGLIAFWLNDVYEKNSVMRNSLSEKYEETSRLKVELEKVATIDFLTKLYNRRSLFDKLEEIRANNLSNQNANFLILIMDIDHFKKINDTYGHIAGDEVLKNVSDTVSKNIRKSDVVCRWGGEEILVVLVNSTLEDGKIVAEKIRHKIHHTITKYENNKIQVTVSVGIKSVEMIGDFDNALTNADVALYKAKQTGRNKIVVYDDI